MRHVIFILIIFISQNLCGQIKFGTYSQLDTSSYANLEPYPDKKFDFYDTRNSSCWAWAHYIGTWELNRDTIAFSWESTWTESYDTIMSITDLKKENVEIKFLYDDGKPIPNVKTSLYCLFENNPKQYYSNVDGKVTIPQKVSDIGKRMCATRDRMLSFDVKDGLSSNTSLDYYADSLSNIFTIIIKKNPKSYTNTETKKYLLKGDSLFDIDRKKIYNFNWGDFKFSTTKYGR